MLLSDCESDLHNLLLDNSFCEANEGVQVDDAEMLRNILFRFSSNLPNTVRIFGSEVELSFSIDQFA